MEEDDNEEDDDEDEENEDKAVVAADEEDELSAGSEEEPPDGEEAEGVTTLGSLSAFLKVMSTTRMEEATRTAPIRDKNDTSSWVMID